MRAGTTAGFVALVLASGLVTFGCQFIAGIAGLEATEGNGGGAGGECDPSSCPAHYACNPQTDECHDSCSLMEGGCTDDGVCAAPMGMPGKCMACGWSPPPPMSCSGCDSCAGNVCTTVCDAPDECTMAVANGVIALNTMVNPKRLECKDQCNGVTVNCMGAALCEVVCEDGGCQSLVLNCSPDGACKLTCNGTSCIGARQECGENTCTAACELAVGIQQQGCDRSCDCTKNTCL
jgi:hypothetical protein